LYICKAFSLCTYAASHPVGAAYNASLSVVSATIGYGILFHSTLISQVFFTSNTQYTLKAPFKVDAPLNVLSPLNVLFALYKSCKSAIWSCIAAILTGVPAIQVNPLP
jgi:hypothetical protein